MSRMHVRIALLMFATLASAGALPAHAACSNASLKGVYGITSVGLNGSGQPATSVDQLSSDGAGHFTGTSTKSSNGTIVNLTFTGTYTVASTCSGTAVFTNSDGTTDHESFALNNVNRGAFLVQTDANHTQSSIAVAEGTATCTDLGVKHTYSVEVTGTITGVGAVVTVGQLTLNGTGKITGKANVSAGGTILTGLPVTGTYAINSNCTGTATFTAQGQAPANVNLVIVNGAKQVLMIETDASTTVNGQLQL